ncbi:hypothetical protein PHLGIDRAFT_168658 [Phlebiopsis gigantea 11061_1 CR5-6]|uniref:Uncharacterized protein n=1 Tax=Phlebiopsis gigantea (strain 11061_1 CR5-6) TaxID=745531 RepID=A0A0C3S834_PHLG1|nr:hypothetical protein PHLGIDRAFT_168658 [Phlebiopsis gigantea 11061_1 CR5-6]
MGNVDVYASENMADSSTGTCSSVLMVSDILHMISHLQTALVTNVLAIVIWDRNRVVLLFVFVLGIVPIGTTIFSELHDKSTCAEFQLRIRLRTTTISEQCNTHWQ